MLLHRPLGGRKNLVTIHDSDVDLGWPLQVWANLGWHRLAWAGESQGRFAGATPPCELQGRGKAHVSRRGGSRRRDPAPVSRTGGSGKGGRGPLVCHLGCLGGQGPHVSHKGGSGERGPL